MTARMLFQQSQRATRDERPVIPRIETGRRVQAALRPGWVRHVGGCRAPLRHHLRCATRPRAAEIMAHANIATPRPIPHPRERSRLPTAVQMQNPRKLFTVSRCAAIRKDAHLHALPRFAGKRQLLEPNRALLPRLRDRDFQRLRARIVAGPKFLRISELCIRTARAGEKEKDGPRNCVHGSN